ncbi:MAG TPA: class IV adenylate cyclase, partial [Tepidisphaeraceae bacterium]|nr:class IV adenylate cyclase [Tepidisphaeraceae bacterium]
MPVEIEAKMKVEDLSAVRERLKAAGAEPAGSAVETNTFFDTEDRALLAGDRGLRTREARRADGTVKATMTYKGPRNHGKLKNRDEFEVMIGDATAAGAMLNALGYVTVLSFQKRRETWRLQGCLVELDELPHLGRFVEVEGPREDVVMAVRDQLGLGERPIVKASYIAMLVQHLQETSSP